MDIDNQSLSSISDTSSMISNNNPFDLWMTNDKENQQPPSSSTTTTTTSNKIMLASERLGAVPENKTFSSKKKFVETKISELDLNSGGGVKRLAVIDPLQSLNGKTRIAKRLFVSPLQKAMSGKKRSSEMNALGDTNGRVSKRMMMMGVAKSTSTSTSGLSQNQQPQPQAQTNFNKKQRIDFLSGKIQEGISSTKLLVEREFDIFVDSVNKVRGVDGSKVYDSCPEVVAKVRICFFVITAGCYSIFQSQLTSNNFLLQINSFLCTYKMVDRSLLYRFLGVHGNTFNSFVQGQNQEKCNNPTYCKAYVFFEKLRIYLDEPKSAARLFHETHYPDGFSTTKKSSKKKKMNNSDAGGAVTMAYEFC